MRMNTYIEERWVDGVGSPYVYGGNIVISHRIVAPPQLHIHTPIYMRGAIVGSCRHTYAWDKPVFVFHCVWKIVFAYD